MVQLTLKGKARELCRGYFLGPVAGMVIVSCAIPTTAHEQSLAGSRPFTALAPGPASDLDRSLRCFVSQR